MQNHHDIGGTDAGLAQRESGLIVPDHLADAPDAAKPKGGTVARDMDGRRRLIFSDEQRRKLNAVLVMLQEAGLGAVVGCIGGKEHADGKPTCGDLLLTEGVKTDDPGYGCKCTRIHWVKPSKGSQNAFMRNAGGRRGRR